MNINELLEIEDSRDAPEKLMKILFDKEKREKIFTKFLQQNADLSYDWFRKYFEDEQAERKSKKQDFTPQCVTEILPKLIKCHKGITYDCCCGTGGIIISKWWDDCLQKNIFEYNPSEYLYYCEEYSNRAIPFLLFNLIIRGMNAIVIQCDVLTREAKGVFFIYNSSNDYLHFSDFNILPYNKEVEKEFNIHFKNYNYDEHIESESNLIIKKCSSNEQLRLF